MGFFYNRYSKPETNDAGTETDSNKNATIYYHKLETPQSEDIPIFAIPENPDHMPGAEVSNDGKYLLMSVTESCDPKNKLYYLKVDALNSPFPKFTPIVSQFEARFSYITNDGPIFWFESTKNAPKGKLVKYNLEQPELGFVDVIPETNDVISFMTVIDNDKLVVVYLKDVKNVARVYNLYSGSLVGELPLPTGSIISSMSGKRYCS